MKNAIIEQLKQELASAHVDIQKESIGRVAEVGDGIARITGLPNALSQEMLSIETGTGVISAIALNLEEGMIGAMILGNAESVREGDIVKSTGNVLSLEAGPELIGRVINPLGQPLDGKGPIFAGKT